MIILVSGLFPFKTILEAMMTYLEISSYFIEFLIKAGILTGICFITGIVLNFLLYRLLSAYNRSKRSSFIDLFIRHTIKAAHLFTPLLLMLVFSSALKTYDYYEIFHQIVYVVFYSSFAWFVVKMVYVFTDTLLIKQDISVKDNLDRRKIVTQIQFLRRLVIFVIIIVFISLILLNFESIRKIGAGILTSAGIAGIVIGIAAQKSLSNLMAGFQIAFSQPIKIDDAVIVENEFGNVEEITLTYVVIKIWDLRRLIVPLNYFIDRPFQNWTRTSADIIGAVVFYVDYTMPVEALRSELTRLLEKNPLWDGKTNILQVTNATERTLEIRALVSAANGGDAWNLRCYIREHLLLFMRKHYMECLPRGREFIQVENVRPQ